MFYSYKRFVKVLLLLVVEGSSIRSSSSNTTVLIFKYTMTHFVVYTNTS